MANTTIRTTPGEDARIAAAFGTAFGYLDDNGDPRDATLAEVKARIIEWVKQVVRAQEYHAAEEAARAGVPDVDPT